MPTYQYQCTACGEGLEAVQKFTDEALTTCPSCDGRLRKIFSAVGVVFKGSGFYRTDSRSSSSSTSTAAKSDGSSTGSGSSDGSGSQSKASSSSSSNNSGTGTSTGSSSTSSSSPAQTSAA